MITDVEKATEHAETLQTIEFFNKLCHAVIEQSIPFDFISVPDDFPCLYTVVNTNDDANVLKRLLSFLSARSCIAILPQGDPLRYYVIILNPFEVKHKLTDNGNKTVEQTCCEISNSLVDKLNKIRGYYGCRAGTPWTIEDNGELTSILYTSGRYYNDPVEDTKFSEDDTIHNTQYSEYLTALVESYPAFNCQSKVTHQSHRILSLTPFTCAKPAFIPLYDREKPPFIVPEPKDLIAYFKETYQTKTNKSINLEVRKSGISLYQLFSPALNYIEAKRLEASFNMIFPKAKIAFVPSREHGKYRVVIKNPYVIYLEKNVSENQVKNETLQVIELFKDLHKHEKKHDILAIIELFQDLYQVATDQCIWFNSVSISDDFFYLYTVVNTNNDAQVLKESLKFLFIQPSIAVIPQTNPEKYNVIILNPKEINFVLTRDGKKIPSEIYQMILEPLIGELNKIRAGYKLKDVPWSIENEKLTSNLGISFDYVNNPTIEKETRAYIDVVRKNYPTFKYELKTPNSDFYKREQLFILTLNTCPDSSLASLWGIDKPELHIPESKAIERYFEQTYRSKTNKEINFEMKKPPDLFYQLYSPALCDVDARRLQTLLLNWFPEIKITIFNSREPNKYRVVITNSHAIYLEKNHLSLTANCSDNDTSHSSQLTFFQQDKKSEDDTFFPDSFRPIG